MSNRLRKWHLGPFNSEAPVIEKLKNLIENIRINYSYNGYLSVSSRMCFTPFVHDVNLRTHFNMMLGVVALEHTLMNSHEQYKSCFNKTVHFTLFYPILKSESKIKKVDSNKNSRKLKIRENFQNSLKKSFKIQKFERGLILRS